MSNRRNCLEIGYIRVGIAQGLRIKKSSPLCKGLFQGAISESGGSFWPVAETRGGNTGICTVKASEPEGVAFQKKLKAKNMKKLRKVPFQAIVDSTQGLFWPVDQCSLTSLQ